MFRVTSEAAASAASFGARPSHARSQSASSDGFSALVDSNTSAEPATERAASPAPDAAAQRPNGSETHAKTDNRAETKTSDSTTGKSKTQTSQATPSTSEPAEEISDAPVPGQSGEASITAEAIAVSLRGDPLSTFTTDLTAGDDAALTADGVDAAVTVVPAIVADVAAAIAVVVPAIAEASTEDIAPSSNGNGAVAITVEPGKAVSAVAAPSFPDPQQATSVATPISQDTVSALPADAAVEAPSVAVKPDAAGTAAAAVEDATTSAPVLRSAISTAVSTESAPSVSLAATEQAGTAEQGPSKPKSVSTALPLPTQTIRSADAEASDAPPNLSTPPGPISDAAQPERAEQFAIRNGSSEAPAAKPDALLSDQKQASAPIGTAPADHRAPAIPAHSAAIDLNLAAPQTLPPQSFQAQTPNVVVTPAAHLNATLANTPVPINGLAVDIALRAAGGASRFEVRLDPAELGRIDVRLDVDRHGNVTSHLTVEKPATLDMLRRDAPQLQRALEDAGLKTGDSGLQFSLRDQSSSGRNDDNGSGRNMQRLIVSEDDAVPVQAAGKTYGRMLGSSGGVDIRI